MSIRATILSEIQDIAVQQKKTLPPLRDDLGILESGLDSLCVAILVATLDEKLGFDPFDGDGPTVFPVTFGELIGLYEHAAA